MTINYLSREHFCLPRVEDDETGETVRGEEVRGARSSG